MSGPTEMSLLWMFFYCRSFFCMDYCVCLSVGLVPSQCLFAAKLLVSYFLLGILLRTTGSKIFYSFQLDGSQFEV